MTMYTFHLDGLWAIHFSAFIHLVLFTDTGDLTNDAQTQFTCRTHGGETLSLKP